MARRKKNPIGATGEPEMKLFPVFTLERLAQMVERGKFKEGLESCKKFCQKLM